MALSTYVILTHALAKLNFKSLFVSTLVSIFLMAGMLSVVILSGIAAGQEENSSGFEYDLSPENEPEELTGENRYSLITHSSTVKRPDKDADIKANLSTMIDIIERMGFAEKAQAARQLLKDNKIVAAKMSKNGYCNSVTGKISINRDDIPSKNTSSADSYRNITTEISRQRARGNDISQMFVTTVTLYHELVHCLQQKFDGSGTAYWLSLGKYSHEVEAHGKDVLFAINLIRNFDEIYSNTFKDSQLTSNWRANIVKALIRNTNYSYGFLRRYQKNLPDGVTSGMISEGHEFINSQVDFLDSVHELDVWDALDDMEEELSATTTIDNTQTPDSSKTITEVDQQLGLIRPQGDHFVFVSVGWLTELANVYNAMKGSAFKTFLNRNMGKRANLNLIYEDGGTAVAGLEFKGSKIAKVHNDGFSNPTVDIYIQRLAIAGLLNGPNFYQALLDAYESDQIQVAYHSASEKRKNAAYVKRTLPSKKKSIAKTKTSKILPKDLLFLREDLILATLAATQPAATPVINTSTPPKDIKPVCTEAGGNINVQLENYSFTFPQFACADVFNHYKIAWCNPAASIPQDKIGDKNYVAEKFYEAPQPCPPCEYGMVPAGCQEYLSGSGGFLPCVCQQKL